MSIIKFFKSLLGTCECHNDSQCKPEEVCIAKQCVKKQEDRYKDYEANKAYSSSDPIFFLPSHYVSPLNPFGPADDPGGPRHDLHNSNESYNNNIGASSYDSSYDSSFDSSSDSSSCD